MRRHAGAAPAHGDRVGDVTRSQHRSCVADLECELWVEGYVGHEIRCGDNECHG